MTISERNECRIGWYCMFAGAFLLIASIPYATILSSAFSFSDFHRVKLAISLVMIAFSTAMLVSHRGSEYLDARHYMTALALFALYFLAFCVYIHLTPFVSDEYDNIVGGMSVVSGRDIYKYYYSQHTPVLYYICAIYELLGARTLAEYRFAMYATLALIWTLMYFRYSPKFGKLTMIAAPLIYITIQENSIPLAPTLLSDQYEAIGLMIVFLEMLEYFDERELTVRTDCWIAFGVLLSFGTAFVAIFPLFAAGFAVLLVEIRQSHVYSISCRKNPVTQPNRFRLLARFWARRYLRLIFVILVPFIILFCWYLVSGNLGNAIKGIYTVNRTYYPQYLAGYGSSILQSLTAPFIDFPSAALTANTYWVYLLYAIVFAFLIASLFKRKWLQGCVGFVFAFLALSRQSMAPYDFHASPFWAICSLMIMITFQIALAGRGDTRPSRKKTVALSLILLLILAPALDNYLFALLKPSDYRIRRSDFTIEYATGSHAYYIDLLTEDGELIEDNTLENNYFLTDNLPLTCSSSTPWMYRAYEEQILNDYKTFKPRVVIFREEYSVWGYSLKSYAPDLIEYVKANYTELPDSDGVYVLNSYYSEALGIVEAASR